MSKKTAQPQERDIEFGIDWEKLDPLLSQPNPYRSLRRRAWLARWNMGKTVPRWEHRKAIMREFWPDVTWHEWADRMVKNLSEHTFTAWIGCASSGKSTIAAMAALQYWLEAPHETTVVVASTTKAMLRRRIWKEIVRLHAQIPKKFGFVGDLLDTECFIRFADGDHLNGIIGMAIDDGPVESAINNLIGIHTARVWIILDEAQDVNEAIMEARRNHQKNPESRMHLMGNPDSLMSMLCRYAAPKDGWDSIPKFTPEWETKSHGYKGSCQALFFDGRKSPACLDPAFAERNPWMINAGQIADHLADVGGNESDPTFMCQAIGWPPAVGIETTILDPATLLTFHCQKPPVWTHGKTACAFLDPAYEGGDKAILQFGWRGWVEQQSDDGGSRWVIGFGDTLKVPIDAENVDRPIHYQIVDFCKEQCKARGIDHREFGLFATGEGGGLKAIFDHEWGPVVGIEEGGAPTERNVGSMGKTAKEEYDTRASELCFLLREFALGNGIRNLPTKAAEQATKRLTFHRGGKWCAEAKTHSKGRVDAAGRPMKGFKTRLGYSPDEFDAAMGLCELARLKGAEPGTGQAAPKAKADQRQKLQEIDAMFSEANYTQEEQWQEYAQGF